MRGDKHLEVACDGDEARKYLDEVSNKADALVARLDARNLPPGLEWEKLQNLRQMAGALRTASSALLGFPALVKDFDRIFCAPEEDEPLRKLKPYSAQKETPP